MAKATLLPDFIPGIASTRGQSLGYARVFPFQDPNSRLNAEYPRQWVITLDSSAAQGGYSFDTLTISAHTASASGTFDAVASQQPEPVEAFGRFYVGHRFGQWMLPTRQSAIAGTAIRIAGDRFSNLGHEFGFHVRAPIFESREGNLDCDPTSSTITNSINITNSIKTITDSLFPGESTLENESDPDQPSAETVVFTVTVKGEWDEIRPAVLKWHERVEEICPDHLNHFGLRVFPE